MDGASAMEHLSIRSTYKTKKYHLNAKYSSESSPDEGETRGGQLSTDALNAKTSKCVNYHLAANTVCISITWGGGG